MPTFQRDPAVDRFLDASIALDADRWASLIETSISIHPEWGAFTSELQQAVSASERSALDKHMKGVIRGPLGELAQANGLRFSNIAATIRHGIFALQKRESIGTETVRQWWSVQFEQAGLRFDDMITAR
ncbi:hypothetical protein [Ruania alba]|uniref:Uncharacterized protein n=1 Tax=Ruania alba TaxID=648782 RepID=A0A1H5KY59_9MICO|nr:hypothetical protein [Ruania alba]SEE69297.1 hypothetical protein SAMN04488554_2493 [Ruania alba]